MDTPRWIERLLVAALTLLADPSIAGLSAAPYGVLAVLVAGFLVDRRTLARALHAAADSIGRAAALPPGESMSDEALLRSMKAAGVRPEQVLAALAQHLADRDKPEIIATNDAR